VAPAPVWPLKFIAAALIAIGRFALWVPKELTGADVTKYGREAAA